MGVVIPSAESVNSLAFPLTEKQHLVAQTLLEVLQAYPQSHILLWAIIFILQAIGLPQTVVAAWFSCSTRNLRYINQKVRTTRRGDGKTGRPPKPERGPTSQEPSAIGYSAYAGLWLLLPVLLESRVLEFARWLTFLVPIAGLVPWQWVRTMMVLAWLGFSRPHHLRDIGDVGVALFTGRRTVLDADRARKGLKAVPGEAVERFYQATAQAEWEDLSLSHPWVSVDEHTVGHQGGPKMPKAKVPRFGRIRAAHHLFGTLVLGARRFVGLVVTQANRRLCHLAPGQLAQDPQVTSSQRKQLTKTANYFERNLPYMDYRTYLANGWPIASGVIEGACRHLVKDRCELSGMRWSQQGTEHLLHLRAVAENDDWDAYHRFRKRQRHTRLYGSPFPDQNELEVQALDSGAVAKTHPTNSAHPLASTPQPINADDRKSYQQLPLAA